MKAAIMRRLRKEEKGFTLIELLAVIVILGVIAAIAVPLIGNVISKSKDDSNLATAQQLYDATRLYVTSELSGQNPELTAVADSGKVTLGTLQSKGYIDNGITLPSTKDALSATGSYIQFDASGNLKEIVLATSDDTKTFQASEIKSGEASPAASGT